MCLGSWCKVIVTNSGWFDLFLLPFIITHQQWLFYLIKAIMWNNILLPYTCHKSMIIITDQSKDQFPRKRCLPVPQFHVNCLYTGRFFSRSFLRGRSYNCSLLSVPEVFFSFENERLTEASAGAIRVIFPWHKRGIVLKTRQMRHFKFIFWWTQQPAYKQ